MAVRARPTCCSSSQSKAVVVAAASAIRWAPQSYQTTLGSVSVTVRLRDAQGQPIQGAVITIDGIGQIQQDTEESAAALTAQSRTPSRTGQHRAVTSSHAADTKHPVHWFARRRACRNCSSLIQAECPITLVAR
jgi:hypothetical protein